MTDGNGRSKGRKKKVVDNETVLDSESTEQRSEHRRAGLRHAVPIVPYSVMHALQNSE